MTLKRAINRNYGILCIPPVRWSCVPSWARAFPFVCSELLGWTCVLESLLVSCINKGHVLCIAGAQQIFVKGTNKHVAQECSRREVMSQCDQ